MSPNSIDDEGRTRAVKYDSSFTDARPVIAALPDHCPRCRPAVSALPVAQLVRGIRAVFVYECPQCRHAWWVGRDVAAYVGWPQGAAA